MTTKTTTSNTLIIMKDSDKTQLSNSDIEYYQTREFQMKREELGRHAIAYLTKIYPGYLWGAQCVGYSTIAINELRFLEWGGDVQGYKIHDQHWQGLLEFEVLLKKFGGELLERGNLARSSLASQASQYGIDKLPDGFSSRFARNHKLKKVKMVGPKGETMEEMKRMFEKRMEAENFSNGPIIIKP